MKNEMKPLSFASAYEELQQIVRALQEEAVDIDELPLRIARATELVQFCREHLRQTEEQVNNITGLEGR